MSGSPFVYTPTDRVSRRLGVFLLIVIGLLLTMTLFFVKTRAHDARADVARLEAAMADHAAAIAVLKAEEAVLTNPERLRALSRDRLGLVDISVEQTGVLAVASLEP